MYYSTCGIHFMNGFFDEFEVDLSLANVSRLPIGLRFITSYFLILNILKTKS